MKNSRLEKSAWWKDWMYDNLKSDLLKRMVPKEETVLRAKITMVKGEYVRTLHLYHKGKEIGRKSIEIVNKTDMGYLGTGRTPEGD